MTAPDTMQQHSVPPPRSSNRPASWRTPSPCAASFPLPGPEDSAIVARLARLRGTEAIRGTPVLAAYEILAQQFGRAVADEIRGQAGLDHAAINQFKKYPLEAFLRFEAMAARKLAGVYGSFDAAIFQLGASAATHFFSSVAGRTMKLLSPDEPHRLVAAVPNGYELLCNFGRHEYHRTGEHAGDFTFTENALGPVHNAGTFVAAFREVYDLELTIAVEQSSPVDFVFKLSW